MSVVSVLDGTFWSEVSSQSVHTRSNDMVDFAALGPMKTWWKRLMVVFLSWFAIMFIFSIVLIAAGNQMDVSASSWVFGGGILVRSLPPLAAPTRALCLMCAFVRRAAQFLLVNVVPYFSVLSTYFKKTSK